MYLLNIEFLQLMQGCTYPVKNKKTYINTHPWPFSKLKGCSCKF